MVYCGWDDKAMRRKKKTGIGKGVKRTFTIIIGEESEYGHRLRKYMETHWKGPLRLCSFTCPKAWIASQEKADCYLLGKNFRNVLQEADWDLDSMASKTILLSDKEEEGCFCRYHPPAELLSMIENLKKNDLERTICSGKSGIVTAIYSPVFEENLKEIAAKQMHPGDLYLGMEDVGDFFSEQGNMGDLCYFIGLQKKEILSYVKEIATERDGIWYIDSPNLYFELLEIKEEEYQWFFQSLRDSGDYGDIYVGLGSGMLAKLNLNTFFDKFLLVDSMKNNRQHHSCDYLEQVLLSSNRMFHGIYERKYREEILYAALQ